MHGTLLFIKNRCYQNHQLHFLGQFLRKIGAHVGYNGNDLESREKHFKFIQTQILSFPVWNKKQSQFRFDLINCYKKNLCTYALPLHVLLQNTFLYKLVDSGYCKGRRASFNFVINLFIRNLWNSMFCYVWHLICSYKYNSFLIILSFSTILSLVVLIKLSSKKRVSQHDTKSSRFPLLLLDAYYKQHYQLEQIHKQKLNYNNYKCD